MNIKQLEYYVAVCQYRSINKAAEAAFIGQSTMSYSIKALEKELNLSLLERTPNGVSLTASGETVLKGAKEILNICSSWDALSNPPKASNPILLEGSGIIADQLIPHIISSCYLDENDLQFCSKECTAANTINSSPAHDQKSVILFDFLSIDKLSLALEAARNNGWESRVLKEGNGSVLMNVNNPLAQKSGVSLQELTVSCFAAKEQSLHSVNPYNSDFKLYDHFPANQIILTPSRESTLKLIEMSENIITMASFYLQQYSEYTGHKNLVSVTLNDMSMPSALVAFYFSQNQKEEITRILDMVENDLKNKAMM